MLAHHPIIVGGDPHGEHGAIIAACLERSLPGTLILLGDCELIEPLQTTYAAVLQAGWQVRYIMGNHEKDHEEYYDNLLTAAPDWNLHCQVLEVGGLRIGGLSGVFKGNVWYPRNGDEMPRPGWETRDGYMKQLRHQNRWKKGLPLKQRDTIFYEDYLKISKLRLDVLVTHEAPLPHTYGYAGLNKLADACRARLLVHGHHHRSYDGASVLDSGRTLHIRGVGIAAPWLLEVPT